MTTTYELTARSMARSQGIDTALAMAERFAKRERDLQTKLAEPFWRYVVVCLRQMQNGVDASI